MGVELLSGIFEIFLPIDGDVVVSPVSFNYKKYKHSITIWKYYYGKACITHIL